MKYFYVLLFAGAFLIACAGCDGNVNVDVTPQLRQTNIEGRTIAAFRANISGVEYYVDDAVYTCIDGSLYVRATSNPYAPASTCVPDLYSLTQFTETDIPLFNG